MTFNLRVSRLDYDTLTHRWACVIENGAHVLAEAAILTCPLPQALHLLSRAKLPIPIVTWEKLRLVTYDRCISFVAETATPPLKDLPRSPLWREPTPSLSGVYHQNKKGILSAREVAVAHASAKLSEELWNLSTEETMCHMAKELSAIFEGATWNGLHLHRWRFSKPRIVQKELFCRLPLSDIYPPLYLCGDAFGSASLEGALLSGERAAVDLTKNTDKIPLRRSR